MNANKEVLADNADAIYPEADPDATSFEYSWLCIY